MPLGDIFISYSQSDRDKAEMLAKALQRENWSVWWDLKIPPGKTFDEVIEQALEVAKCVIVLWSKKSVRSRWVKAEAAEGNSRSILIPARIEDDLRIPLEFRYLQASRLTDWQGQQDHTEFGELRAAVAALIGSGVRPPTSTGDTELKKSSESGPPAGAKLEIPEGLYLDPETKLMWTVSDNGADINWKRAIEYAKTLRLGGYSDWRLPTIDELEKLYDPASDKTYKIREPFQLTGLWVWSSTKKGSDSAWDFYLFGDKRSSLPIDFSYGFRVLCVRRSGK